MVFVIDSADRERLEIAKQELDLMLQEEELRGAPVLILANKQDLPNAMNELEVSTWVNMGSFVYEQAYSSFLIAPIFSRNFFNLSIIFLDLSRTWANRHKK